MSEQDDRDYAPIPAEEIEQLRAETEEAIKVAFMKFNQFAQACASNVVASSRIARDLVNENTALLEEAAKLRAIVDKPI